MVIERNGLFYCERPNCNASFDPEVSGTRKKAQKQTKRHEADEQIHKKQTLLVETVLGRIVKLPPSQKPEYSEQNLPPGNH